jgi:hypothetical protein
MAVGHGQQFLGALGQPAIARGRLTLGAVAVAAGVVGDGALGTVITLLDMTAQSSGAADADVTQSFPLLRRHRASPAAQELYFVGVKDIG